MPLTYVHFYLLPELLFRPKRRTCSVCRKRRMCYPANDAGTENHAYAVCSPCYDDWREDSAIAAVIRRSNEWPGYGKYRRREALRQGLA